MSKSSQSALSMLSIVPTGRFSVLGCHDGAAAPTKGGTTASPSMAQAKPKTAAAAAAAATASAATSNNQPQAQKDPKIPTATREPAASAASATAPAVPELWTDELQWHYEQILSVGEECISASELRALLQSRCGSALPVVDSTTATTTTATTTNNINNGFVLYDGFEPSGRMHIAQGVLKAVNVNKCTACPGATFCFWVADWFALMKYVCIYMIFIRWCESPHFVCVQALFAA
jgi:tRNA synthetases class I (W and Y)